MTRALGLALVEFLWQGAAIGALAALVLAAMRRRSPHARYFVAVLALALMAATPAIGVATRRDEAPLETRVTTPAPAAPTASATASPAAPAEAPSPFSRAWLEPRLPYVVSVWCGGVLLLFAQLLRGWLGISRLRRRARPVSGHWSRTVRELSSWLGVKRHLEILESALVDVPAVIGFLRPAILVPASALAGLPPAHLEAILAHELAHIRRGDYLVNVLQCVVETLLFYHPAVWWVSKQVRVEREHCCDDEAAIVCGDRVSYAHALVSLEELRGAVPRLAVAASGGVLLNRIRRLLDPASVPRQRLSGGFVMTVVLSMILLSIVGETQSKTPQALTPIESAALAPTTAPVAPVAPRAKTRTAPASPTLTGTKPQRMTQPPSSLSGTVKDKDGGAIPGVTVIVAIPSGDLRTLTNGNGSFALPNLPAGTYTLSFSMAGFQLTRRQITIPASGSVSMAVTLQLGVVTDEVTINGQTTGAPAKPAEGPTAGEYFDLAKRYYEQGRLADAELMTLRALEWLRAGTPAVTSPGPAAVSTGPVRVGGEIKEPRSIYKTKPVYPQFALAAQVQGTVYVEAVIAKDGSIKDATVVSGPSLLREAALEAVRQWRYTPTLLGGNPVEVIMTVTVTFQLGG